MDTAFQRTIILTNHLLLQSSDPPSSLSSNACLSYSAPEDSENYAFDIKEMRNLIDGHHGEERDWLFGLMMQSELFNPKMRGGKVFVSPDHNQSMEQQREMTMKRIEYLQGKRVFEGWLTGKLEDIVVRDVLGTLRSLYALTCTEDGSYLRYGYLSVDTGGCVRREITKLCSELRPHALALVTSFGIPNAFLSPLAFDWIEANSWSSVEA